MAITLEMLNELDAAGIHFVASVRRPGGFEDIHIFSVDVLAFMSDPIAFAARHYRASKESYLEWVETDGNPRCSAVTRRGRRCLNGCGGGIQKSMAEWLELDGGLCKIHGGPGYDELHEDR